jgi:putative ABC transport system permease protein
METASSSWRTAGSWTAKRKPAPRDARHAPAKKITMRPLRAFFMRLGGLFGKQRRDRELEAEMASHLAMHIEDNVRAGMTAEEGRRQAVLKLGGVEQTKENYRERRGLAWLDSLIPDIRFGLRMLGKNPGFTVIAILTLALGIGANTAIYSVIDGVLLNPIPYPQPNRIVSVYTTWPSYEHAAFSYPNFLDLQRETGTLSGLASWRVDSFTLSGTAEPEEIRGKMTTGNFFSLLGVRPILGRVFRGDDDRLGATPVAILGDGLWKRRFGSDREIIGKTIVLSGQDYTVIGVVPSDVHFLRFQDSFFDDVFLPLGRWDNPLIRDRRFSLGLRTVGRLGAGVDLSHARAEMREIGKNLDAAYPGENNGMGLGIIPFKDELIGPIRTTLLLLWGAVGLVLLIACANVGSLLLVHSATRRREFTIRAALGASRGRLTRQVLIESTLLAVIGGTLGILLASWGTGAVLHLFPGSLPPVAHVETNFRVLLFALGLCVATGMLFGTLPAFKVSKYQLNEELKEGGRGASGPHHRAQGVFIVTETSLALVLLVAAGLLIRSLTNVWAVNPGFNSERLLAFSVAFSPGKLSSPERAHTVLRELNERMAVVPGVEAAGLNLGDLPLEGDSEFPFWPDEKPKPAEWRNWPLALGYTVSPDYFKTMGIPLIRGRVFSEQDGAASPSVAVIDEDTAKGIFPGADPIGKRIDVGLGMAPVEVIGVVGHVKHFGLDTDAGAPVHYEIYSPYLQLSGPLLPIAAGSTWALVRTGSPPTAILEALRRELGALDSGAAVYDMRSMNAIVEESLAGRTFSMVLLAIFAGIAVLLAAIGIYGVVSYLVVQRTHEIGIRMALGARPGDVLGMVLWQGGQMAVAGIVLGLVASFGVTRLMATMLFGVSATDPVTFAGVAVMLLAIALAACCIPALRAMRVDPMVALRYE